MGRFAGSLTVTAELRERDDEIDTWIRGAFLDYTRQRGYHPKSDYVLLEWYQLTKQDSENYLRTRQKPPDFKPGDWVVSAYVAVAEDIPLEAGVG